MSKLRELIAEDKRKGNGYRLVPIETMEHIADLIDAAQAMKTACSTGYVGNDGKPMGVRFPEKACVNDLRAALDKLLEPK